MQLDSSRDMLFRDTAEPQSSQTTNEDRCSIYRLVANEEGTLPSPTGTFDLVMSALALHWVNDLPKLFSEIRRFLKPDGCFLLAMMGGYTLPVYVPRWYWLKWNETAVSVPTLVRFVRCGCTHANSGLLI
jgi:SAM-dependent methyltransferase